MKALHFEKIEDIEESTWADVGLDDIAKKLFQRGIFDEIEVIFAAKEAKRITQKRKGNEKKIAFLKTDVIQQFGFSLHFFASEEDSVVVLRTLRCEKVVLKKPALMEFLAKPELNEISTMLAKDLEPYSTDWTSEHPTKPEKGPHELARADRIYLELIYNLRHYWKSRMRALNAILNYEKDYEDLVKKLETVDVALDSLESSDNLRQVIDIILVVGNYMNSTSKQAQGFKLSSLHRLTFLKGHKNTFSFLHYVEKIIRENYPEVLNFVLELKTTFPAAKVFIEQLKQDYAIFSASIRNIDSSLQNGNLSDSSTFHPEDQFLNTVLKGLPDARMK
ncbi:unnamed protein product [Ambrosiozyma monospora]|uniref:Unnamed protein product n=1 Tax=Ambrosiozyma monospora TaxID=43982 RepID=A0ACB5SUB1_AMBMO|nr:unnamed protein product [Ambrosiozyma monospora]